MIKKFVQDALAEDVGRGDLYALVEPSKDATAKIVAKSDGVVAGVKYVDVLADQEGLHVEWLKQDSQEFVKGEVIAKISGSSHTLLACERTILNMLLHASSIATLTRKYVKLIEPYGTKLLDTRKTIGEIAQVYKDGHLKNEDRCYNIKTMKQLPGIF